MSNKPKIIIDTKKIQSRINKLKAEIKDPNVKILFCVKSLPNAFIYEKLKSNFDGIEISNRNELLDRGAQTIVLNSPDFNEAILACAEAYSNNTRLLCSIDSESMFNQIKDKTKFLIRVSSTSLLTQKLIDEDLQLSRFGFDVNHISSTVINHPNFSGFHIHLGRFIQHYRDIYYDICLNLKNRFGDSIPIIDIGGGLYRAGNTSEIVTELRTIFPKSEILLELGRWFSQGCITAKASIINILGRDNYLDVYLNFSALLHAQWCDEISIVGITPNDTKLVKLSGPTCFEGDTLGFFNINVADLEIGKTITLNGLSGYCTALNNDFNGIDAAEIEIL